MAKIPKIARRYGCDSYCEILSFSFFFHNFFLPLYSWCILCNDRSLKIHATLPTVITSAYYRRMEVARVLAVTTTRWQTTRLVSTIAVSINSSVRISDAFPRIGCVIKKTIVVIKRTKRIVITPNVLMVSRIFCFLLCTDIFYYYFLRRIASSVQFSYIGYYVV